MRDHNSPATLGGVGLGYYRIAQSICRKLVQQDALGFEPQDPTRTSAHRTFTEGVLFFKTTSLGTVSGE